MSLHVTNKKIPYTITADNTSTTLIFIVTPFLAFQQPFDMNLMATFGHAPLPSIEVVRISFDAVTFASVYSM